MTEEKNIDTSKQENQPQDKSDERLSDEQLDKIAGGNVVVVNGCSSGTSGKMKRL